MGNGHATLWRGLLRALARQGHESVFFEHDVPYYARHRDAESLPGTRLYLYDDWERVRALARHELADADVGIVTSYCVDGIAATALLRESSLGLRVYYDLDTPVTIASIEAGETPPYIGADGLRAFDLSLSYTGGKSLDDLRQVLGARAVEPLFGSVDPDVHHPVAADGGRVDLSYLGTFAADRQAGLLRLFLDPARRQPGRTFALAGSLYPADIEWPGSGYALGLGRVPADGEYPAGPLRGLGRARPERPVRRHAGQRIHRAGPVARSACLPAAPMSMWAQ